MLFVDLCPGTPEGSTGSGSGFKASQKSGDLDDFNSTSRYLDDLLNIDNHCFE